MRCGNCGYNFPGRPARCPRCAAQITYESQNINSGNTAQKTRPPLNWLAKTVLCICIFVLVWFLAFLCFGILGSCYYDGEDKAAGNIYSLSMLFGAPAVAAFCTHAFSKKLGPTSKQKSKIPVLTNPKTHLPVFQKDRIAVVESLSKQAALHYKLATESDSVVLFMRFWEKMEKDLADIEPYYGKVPPYFTTSVHKLTDHVKNKQWKLRDVIERAKDCAIADIKGEHRNNKLGRFNDFKTDIDNHCANYDAETSKFAQEAIDEVSRVAGIGSGDHYPENDIHHMEGRAFEHWCANLLSKIGYTDVSVTRGSGDQGVDVLAQKDGIKYAIQCKCYSSDLGNTPVQEVLAGKKFYHCHVGAVMTNRHFTKGAKELAAETGILLWDRDWINQAAEASTRK